MKFRKVAVGGTFDHLHDGHLALLRRAFEVGERVYLGVCSDEMVKSKGCRVQPLGQRLGRLLEAVFTEFGEERVEVVVIRDPYGPAISDPELEAIVVSPETRARAEEINRIRKEKGLKELEILEVPFVLAEDGKPISSTRIRRGEIDPHGRLIKGG
jgi:pantetheine-phosphate adenylyltransferase